MCYLEHHAKVFVVGDVHGSVGQHDHGGSRETGLERHRETPVSAPALVVVVAVGGYLPDLAFNTKRNNR